MCEQETRRLSVIREVVRSLVLRALVGDLATVEAAKLYFVDGLSPSEILPRLGLPRSKRYAIRGRIQRVGNGARVARVVAEVYGRLLELKPAVVKDGAVYRCLKCGRVMGGNPHVHILQSHPRLLEETVEEVLRG